MNPQQIRLEKKLNREYKRLNYEIEQLTSKYPYDHIESQVQQILSCQFQIIKELEQCTGEKIHLKTREEILAEQEMFQHSSAAGWLDVHKRKQEQRDKFEAAMHRGRERIAAAKKAENAKYTFKVSQDRVNKEGAGLDPWL